MFKRKLEEMIFRMLMIFSTGIIVFILLCIIWKILALGINSVTLEMITESPKSGFYLGGEGGIFNAIFGSLYLTSISTFAALLISLPIVIYLNVYLKHKSKFSVAIRFALDVMWGIPSIVYGIFGFTLMLFLGLKISLLGGIIAVTLLQIPIISRAIDEVLKAAPYELEEAAFSLGATKIETAVKVLLKQIMPGIITAVLIAFGRGIGDAAAVMFTSGYSDNVSFSLLRPAATLPLAVFYQLNSPSSIVQERAYASAFILTVIILVISLSIRFLNKKFTRNIIK
ncbi:phosphate ABC transporter permease PstA [Candidatus Dependentiae bacterium]|nr:phosphate ABC transporter permease PstA [Candidatus Dependentiae bacterium]